MLCGVCVVCVCVWLAWYVLGGVWCLACGVCGVRGVRMCDVHVCGVFACLCRLRGVRLVCDILSVECGA